MTGEKGFTLIELMVTIAIAAILVTVAVPSFSNFITNNRLNIVADEIVNTINFVRSESVKRNSPIVFCRVASATATTCDSDDVWSHWVILAGTNVIRRGDLNSYNSTLSVKSDLTDDRVVFGGDGLARTGGSLINESTFTICSNSGSGDSTRTVAFGAASRISINRSSGACS